MNAWPRVCGCGRSWTAEQWATLRLVGYQDDGVVERLELRDCSCGSTLSILVPPFDTDGEAA